MAAVGNFKGVMLCNRPVQIPGSQQAVSTGGGGTAADSSSVEKKPAFISAVCSNTALGTNPIKRERLRTQPKLKADDVTWRHKRWLADFQQRRQAITKVMEKKAERIRKNTIEFRKRSAIMREMVRTVKYTDPANKEAMAHAVYSAYGSKPACPPGFENVPLPPPIMPEKKSRSKARTQEMPPIDLNRVQQQPQQRPQPQLQPQQQNQSQYHESPTDNASLEEIARMGEEMIQADNRNGNQQLPSFEQETQQANQIQQRKAKRNTNLSKPVWALTEAENEDAVEDEIDDLLDFAANLDYDTYIDDLEVREALHFVKDRVKQLETQEGEAISAEKKAQLEEARRKRREELAALGLSESQDDFMKDTVPGQMYHDQAQDGDALDQGPGWNNSTRVDYGEPQHSLLAEEVDGGLLRNVHSKASLNAVIDRERKNMKNTLPAIQEATADLSVPAPLVTVTHARKGTTEIHPSNLPFLYRHPSV